MNTTTHADTQLFEAQLKLEQEMIEKGRDRFLNATYKAEEKGQTTNTAYGARLLKRGIEPISLAIDDFIAQASTGKAGRKHSAISMLKDMDTRVVAFIALRATLDKITKSSNIRTIALYVAREIELEKKLTHMQQNDKERYDVTQQHIKKSNTRSYRQNVLRYAFGKSETVDFEPWNAHERLHLGIKLVELIEQATGFIEITKERTGYDDKFPSYVVNLRDTCRQWIEEYKEKAAILYPAYMPTIYPPKPWDSVAGGGYYSDNMPRLSLVKTPDREYLQALDKVIETGQLDKILKALNALQNTPWRINKKVYEVLEHLWEKTDADVAGLPPRESLRLPLCPVCGADITDNKITKEKHDCFDMMEEETLKAWKKKAAIVHQKNASGMSKRLTTAKTLSLARQFMDYDAFYFPYQLDFRGRIYTIPSHLTPQGTGLAKGLLEFSEGKPLKTMKAVKWLAIHGCNCFGNDKVSLDERYSWVLQNQDKILASAQDPLGDGSFWLEADDPFPFLAFCFEWAGYVAEGLDFVNHIEVAMDGTCNGLQIYSLILRDEVGGYAVNLTPTELPQDIYGIVAQKVTGKLQDVSLHAFEERPIVEFLQRLIITRKTTKRQVMVLPYGGTFDSCKEYTDEWLKEVMEDMNMEAPEGLTRRGIAIFLAKLIWQAIEETVIKAREAMVYLQEVAGIVNKADMPIKWTTPMGLPITQHYKNNKERRLKTNLGDSIVYLSVQEEIQDTLNKSKQKSAIAPNFVHSLDASALMYTINLCHDTGIEAFAMIHDSYGTHACDSENLAQSLRKAFVEMFGGTLDLLDTWKKEVLACVPDKVINKLKNIPSLPEKGALNVEDVLQSQYFFA